MSRPEMIESIALQISDGEAVTWDPEDSAENAAVVDNLRILDALARTLREQESGPDVPDSWGPLKILEHIGSGASADVFRAHDPALQRDVALKLFRCRDPEQQQRLLEEGRLMAKVRHPSVVQVFGIEEHDGRTGLWMELIEGQDLDAIVEADGPFSPAEAALIGRELCSALAAVHQAGLLFRDIKLQNVIRERGGNLKLTDFGSGIRTADITAERISGTPYYLAPELLDGVPASPRSDLYALGVLLYRLVSGEFPIEGDTVDELQDAHRRGPRHLLDARPDLPAGFAGAVETAISTDPAARFGTPGEFAAALQDSKQPARGARRYAIGAVVLFLVAAAVYWVWPTGYEFDAPLHRLNPDQTRTALAAGDTVDVGDNLALEITASTPVYVYVFSEDSRGNAWSLFPLQSLGHENPLAAGVTHFLPSTAGDNLAWTVDSAAGTERIHIVASPKPVAEIAARFASLPPAQLSIPGFESRGIGSLTRQVGQPNVSAGAIVQAARALSGEAESISGVSYRVIDLDNTAE